MNPLSLRLLPIVCYASLVGCASEPAPTGPASDDAIAAIALPERQLRTFLIRSVLGTQSGPMALYDLGLERGCAALGTAVDEAVRTHLPAWRHNLIAAYRENVPADELARATQKDPSSAMRRLREYRRDIGGAMKSKSSDLLQRAGVQVLSAMSDEASKTDRSQINKATREAELQEAMNKRDICGDQLRQAEGVRA